MLTYPNISPVAFSLGPVQVHWYGLMYLFAFLAGWGLARWRASRPAWIAAGWNAQKADDLLTWIMLGVVAGGRLGYMRVILYRNIFNLLDSGNNLSQ